MRKQLIALLLVLVCAASLFAGCKTGGQDAESTVASAPETVSTAVTTEAAKDTTAVTEEPSSEAVTTEEAQTEPVTEEPTTEEATTQPPATQPPATQPPATQPPATQPPATQPPATQPPTTEPPVSETLSSAQKQAIAESLIGKPVSSLYAAIGYPNSTYYDTSCNAPEGTEAYDGQLYYDGFTVYTYRQGDKEVVTDVWAD